MIDFKPEDSFDFQLDFQPDEETPSGKKPSLLDTLTGLGEETLALGTGFAATPLAGLAGLSSTIMGGVDKGVATQEAVQQALTYRPRTARGQELTEAAGQILNLPGEYGEKAGGAVGRFIGGDVGERTGEFLGRVGGEFATDLIPVGGAVAAVKGMKKVPKAAEAAPKPTPAQAAAAAMEREAAVKIAQQREVGGQMEMFPETPLEGQATPYEAGQMGVTEPVAPKLQRRQMELPFGEEVGPLTADIQGQIFRGDVTTPEARLGLQEAERATVQELKKGTILEHPPGEPLPYLQAPELPFNVRTRKQGGGILWHGTPWRWEKDRPSSEKIGTGEGAQARGWGLYWAESPEVAEIYANDITESVRARDLSPLQGLIGALEAKLEADKQYQRGRPNLTRAEKEGIYKDLMDLKGQLAAAEKSINPSLYKLHYPDALIEKMVDWDIPLERQPFKVKQLFKESGYPSFESWLKSSDAAKILQQAGFPGIKYKDAFAAQGKGTTRNYVTFPGEEVNVQVLERNQQSLAQQGRIRKQGGGILFDFGKKPEMDKIAKGPLKKAFPEFTRVAETPEEVAALAAVSPDVERGVVGKTIAQFTKGMLFEKLKTDNPVLKYTYDTVSEAIDAATFTVKNLIQKTLNPTLMALSKQEKGEVGDLLVSAMKNKKDLTPEFMREHGFNEKQIKAAMTLKEVHTENFKNLNESRRLAGKPPLEPYVGYVAGLATGNFRRLIVERGPDGTPKLDASGAPIPVGYVGSDFRRTMNRRVDALLQNNPDWMALPEKYTGVAKRKQESTQALVDALTILSDGNPNFDRFGKAMDELITGDTYRALGAKKHTMGKKGIMGMEGDKPWQDSYENAMDLFNAQIRYTETMAKWAEFSKAMDKLSVVFSDPAVQKQQPNALEMADDYIKNAMGQNPSQVGQAIEGLIGSVGEQMGVGPAVLRHTISAARNTVNTLFFALNHGWMILNTIQPALSMPTTKAFMRGRGIDLNWDLLGTTDLLAKGGYSSMKHLAGWKETPFEQAMWKYAKEHGIDQTNLVDSHHHLQQGPSYWLNQSLKLGANAVEAGPRSVMFATISHLLDAAGHGKDPDIFPVARQLTDMAMVDLRKHEQIKATKHLGMLGEMSANLTSYPQNQLSAWATYAREMGKGNYGAFTTALISAVAYAGVMGLPGFTQADYITEMLSRMMGKPTSLTKLTLDMANDVNSQYHSKVGDVLAMGVGAYYGVDLHTRLGNPSMIPTLTGGGGKLLDIGEAGWEVAKDPSEWNKRLLMKEVALPPFKPWIDQNWFTRTTSLGEQIALNKEGKGTVMRTEKDILFKKLGFTGSAESKGKALDYAASQQDKYYDDMRKKISTRVQKASAAYNGAIPEAQLQALIKDYIDAEGAPDSFPDVLEKAGVNFNTTTRARRILQNAQGTSISAARRLERTPR